MDSNKNKPPANGGRDDAHARPLALETAVATGRWGWRFAAIAAQAGVEVAAALPLPAYLEAEAKVMAGSLTANPAALAEPYAKFPTVAEDAYRTAEALMQKVREAATPTPEVLREAHEAVRQAEELGRMSALMARVTFLSVRAHRPPTQKVRP